MKKRKMVNNDKGKIKDNIIYIIEFQKKMGYHMPSIVNPPATDNELKDTEEKVGMMFNEELKELFKTINGILIDRKTPSGLTGIIPIHDLIDLKSAVSFYHQMDWDTYWEMYEEIFETRFDIGNQLFPFIHDGGGNCYWVDLNEGTKNYGRLYRTNTFGEEPGYLFNSLTDFFEAIKRGYEKGIFTLDKNHYLKCDYKEWGEICHKLDKTITYWKNYIKN